MLLWLVKFFIHMFLCFSPNAFFAHFALSGKDLFWNSKQFGRAPIEAPTQNGIGRPWEARRDAPSVAIFGAIYSHSFNKASISSTNLLVDVFAASCGVLIINMFICLLLG